MSSSGTTISNEPSGLVQAIPTTLPVVVSMACTFTDAWPWVSEPTFSTRPANTCPSGEAGVGGAVVVDAGWSQAASQAMQGSARSAGAMRNDM